MQTHPDEYQNDDVPAAQSVEIFPNIKQNSGYYYCPQYENRARLEIPTLGEFDTAVNQFKVDYGTRHDSAVLWATRLMSPNWSSVLGTTQAEWNSADNPRFMVLLSDGNMNRITNVRAFYALDPKTERDWYGNFENICTFAKSKGVKIITISYEFDDTMQDTLRPCASEGYAFSATTGNIKEVFSNIATLITLETLRIAS